MHTASLTNFILLGVFLSLPGLGVCQETPSDTPGVSPQHDELDVEGYTDLNIDFSDIKEKAGFSARLGVDYNQGTYGDPERTNLTYMPVTLSYEQNRWAFQVSIGHISLSGKDIIIPGTGLTSFTNDAAIQDRSRHESGLGDLYLSATYALEPLQQESVFLDLTSRVKIPTGDSDKGLSTGKTDISFQIDVAKLMGNIAPFATLGYRHVGKSDRFLLQDTWFASVGVIYYPTPSLSLGLSYDTRRSATVDTVNPREILGFMDMQITRDWAVNIYGIAGLSEGSPDFGTGLHLRYMY
ncbi:transporter [Paremcibacter congregatus]|uniref:transporter n=1 Tax=Paremcibacter congregatus TaxID=2043170 RepID=UPI003A932406